MGFFDSLFGGVRGFLNKGLGFVNSLFGGGQKGGDLMQKVAGSIGKFRSQGIGSTLKEIGRTAIDSIAERALNSAFDKGKEFVSGTIGRKIPQLVSPLQMAGDVLKDTLSQGYKSLLYGSNGASGGGFPGIPSGGLGLMLS